jgi:hypothetical protein
MYSIDFEYQIVAKVLKNNQYTGNILSGVIWLSKMRLFLFHLNVLTGSISISSSSSIRCNLFTLGRQT